MKQIKNQNFFQFYEVKDLDLCNLIEDISGFPLFQKIYDLVQAIVPGLIQKCPYPVSNTINQFVK